MSTAMPAIVEALAAQPQTRSEKRAAINRRHYQQNRDRYLLHRKIQIWRKWAGKIQEALSANP